MGLKRWTGSAYKDVTPALIGASSTPTAVKLWIGGAYTQVWPPVPPNKIATNGVIFDASPSAPTSFTMNYPSGSASGNMLFGQFHISKSAAEAVALTPSNLTGGATWVFIQQRDDSATNGVYMAYFWARRGSETSVVITPTPTTNMRSIICTLVAYDDSTVDVGMPVGDFSNGYLLTSNTTGIAAPAVFTEFDNCEVLLFSTSSNGTDTALSTTWTNADGEYNDQREWVSAQTSNFQHSAAYDARPTGGNTTTYTATPSTTSAGKVAAALVIHPKIILFPRLTNFLSDFGDTNASSTNITMPSANTGDLLFVEFLADGSQTSISTSSSGWTKIGQYANSTNCTLALFAGVQGTAAALTIAQTTSSHRTWIVRSVENWSGNVSDIEVGTATGTSTNMNPPSLTPTAGSQKYLWGAIGVGSQNSTWPTLPPASWSNFLNVRCNATAGSTHVGLGDAWQLRELSVVDPGAFTATSSTWLAATVAIR